MDTTTAVSVAQPSSPQPECNCPEVCTHDHENE